MIASIADVVSAVGDTGTSIPVGFFVATAQHESGFKVDLQEPNDQPEGSWGIYCLSPREFRDELGLTIDISQFMDLAQATQLFARLCEKRLARLREAAGLGPDDDAGGALWAFLFLAHNRGIGKAVLELQNNGPDWESYIARNRGRIAGGWESYGNDVIAAVSAYGGASGGSSDGSQLIWWAAAAVVAYAFLT